ncbi:hypothetical protein XELAEV_18009320mg [Xenopus laevis]|uniref:Uncharacterized protein n=1 Tax=Xenopus laevis TaxID=8355 RepID=A0A974I0B3_XENLA|nr:hypothetical protein XELAEV_18009320mg [Xenopus laevis]
MPIIYILIEPGLLPLVHGIPTFIADHTWAKCPNTWKWWNVGYREFPSSMDLLLRNAALLANCYHFLFIVFKPRD